MARIFLHDDLIGRAVTPILDFGEFRVATFRYPTGVAAVRITNSRGTIVVLPFDGQQIWDVIFDDRRVTMRSMFTEPRGSVPYLETYGAFLLHCGATAMGGPRPSDTHPLHGELPHARYQEAWIELGEDERGPWVELSGTYQHTVAFAHNYIATPRVRMGCGSATLEIGIAIENLKRTPMDLMYLAHINIAPVDNGRLVYSARCDTDHVRVRTAIPSHITPPAGHREFLQRLAADPALHNTLSPGLPYDPEVVLYVDYEADEAGWARTMQVHPGGGADVIRHRPSELDHGVRWISRTPDQDCLGAVLPATAEPEGYTAEKEKGNVKTIAAGARWETTYEAGILTAAEAEAEARLIERTVG